MRRTDTFGRCARCGQGFTVADVVVIIDTGTDNICSECSGEDRETEFRKYMARVRTQERGSEQRSRSAE